MLALPEDWSATVERLMEPGQPWALYANDIRETIDMYRFCSVFGWTPEQYSSTDEKIRNRFKCVMAGEQQANEVVRKRKK